MAAGALEASAWAQPDQQLDLEEMYPMRLPYANEIKRAPKPRAKGLRRIALMLQSLDPRALAWSALEEVMEFLLFWFGAMRFDHAGYDDIASRLQELAESAHVLADLVDGDDDDGDKKKKEVDKKLEALRQKEAAVKGGSKKGVKKDPKARTGRQHFGRVKKPKKTSVMKPEAPRGKPSLKVTVISASGLRRSDWSIVSGSLPPDPYFTCELVGGKSAESQHFDGKKDAADKTTDPVYNIAFEFKDYQLTQSLHFKLYDQDDLGDDLLGEVVLSHQDIYPHGFFDERELTLKGKTGNGRLFIRVDVVFPQAHGWGGVPPKARGKPAGWGAEEFEQDEDDFVVGQTPPIFVILQCSFAFLIWVFGQGKEADPMSGLESFLYGDTSLLLQRDCTEDLRFQPWRWFAYQFTHVGISHIGFNCLMIALMAPAIEGFNGTISTFLMFNAGVFGGACCWMVSDNHVETVGMSGGCYSLIGITLGDLLMNWKEMKYAKTMLMMVLVIPAVDFIQATFSAHENVSNAAHFGGTVAGLIAAITIGKNIKVTKTERILWFVAVAVGVVATAFCLFWGLSDEVPMTLFDQVRYCWHRQIVSPAVFGDSEPRCVRCSDEGCARSWSNYVVQCGADCVMGTVGLGDCMGKYGGFMDDMTAPAPTTTTGLLLWTSTSATGAGAQ